MLENAPPPPPERTRERAPKLSWNDKKELEGMEARILEAEEQAEALEVAVHAPDFYKGDAEAVKAALRRLEEAKQEVERLYARWQELERIAGGLGG